MKIAFQIVLLAFMVLYLCGVVGDKGKDKWLYLAAGVTMAAALIATITLW